MPTELVISLSLLTFGGIAATFSSYYYEMKKNWLLFAATFYWVGTSAFLGFLISNTIFLYKFGFVSVCIGTAYMLLGTLVKSWSVLRDVIFDF